MNLERFNKLDIKNSIVNWFLKNSNVNKEDIEKNFNSNYLEVGWIDSLQFVSFISDIENKFKIRFQNDEFQNKKFASINGLTELIEKKMNTNE